jgi:hypothetical protein
MQSSGSRKTLRWLFASLILLLAVALAWHFWPAAKPGETTGKARPAAGGQASAPVRPGFGNSTAATPVRIATAVLDDFPVYYKALGTVTATNTINVRSRVAGELVKVFFEEGQKVKAGDLLAQIDPRSYEIALQQAQGTLLQNQAQLKNARIDLQGAVRRGQHCPPDPGYPASPGRAIRGHHQDRRSRGQRCAPEPGIHPHSRTHQRTGRPAPTGRRQPGRGQRHDGAGGHHSD